MSEDGRGRIPRRAGRHVLIIGATGSGKTVSARRWVLAGAFGDDVGVLVSDPKGDRGLEHDLRKVARVVGRPSRCSIRATPARIAGTHCGVMESARW